ncbi:ABC transporter ATP-binding protein [Virgibacillus proomii]|jgi:ABC-2 type transport system ATP-binding protein|uniref:ABC transporter ATP-binding protein n=1 Tax=Virgibacillus proomii TaxID=84407 RepID=UPI0009876BD3|nr:ABC transporter ATP-binding protein [Virgibacillus proomii]
MDAISIKKLTKTYADKKSALNEFDLSVKQGEIFSLLGSNGAGKTTLINILTTFLKPTTGNVQILGKDLENETQFIRSNIACVAQHVSTDDNLTLKENMRFQGRLYGLDKERMKKRMNQLVDIFNLSDYIDKKTEALSGGIKRRLDIAMSMMSYPKILFLDEPTVGMDIQSRQSMWEMLKKIKKGLGVTIFLTTHYLEEADMLSDTICFIKDGKKVLQDSPANLKRFTSKNIIRIITTDIQDSKKLEELLLQKDYVKYVTVNDRSLDIQVNDSQLNFLDLNYYVLRSKISFEGIEIIEPTLDDIFLEIIDERKN